MPDRLKGKVALMSGAARGLGEADAKLFAHEGAGVVLGDILERDGQRTAEAIRAEGQAVFVKLDVAQETDWSRAVDFAVKTFGKLNILVNIGSA